MQVTLILCTFRNLRFGDRPASKGLELGSAPCMRLGRDGRAWGSWKVGAAGKHLAKSGTAGRSAKLRIVLEIAVSARSEYHEAEIKWQQAHLEFLHLRHSLESDFAALIVGGISIRDRTFAEFCVQFVDCRHKPCVSRLIE